MAYVKMQSGQLHCLCASYGRIIFMKAAQIMAMPALKTTDKKSDSSPDGYAFRSGNVRSQARRFAGSLALKTDYDGGYQAITLCANCCVSGNSEMDFCQKIFIFGFSCLYKIGLFKSRFLIYFYRQIDAENICLLRRAAFIGL